MKKQEKPVKKPKPQKPKKDRRLEPSKKSRPEASLKPKIKTKKESEIVFVTGKRKRAIARARLKKGSGVIKINSVPLSLMQNEMLKLRIQEPLIIAGEEWKRFDISINVKGGGIMGQAEAARQAIAKGLVEYLGDGLRERYVSYDRNLLVYDPRRTEPHKPPRSSQGPRRYKQRSKR